MTPRIFNPYTECMTRDALRELQWRKLERLIVHAYSNAPLYHDLMCEAGIKPTDIRSLEDYRRLFPTVDKATLLADQNALPPYGRRLAVNPRLVTHCYLTSGTSGNGQEVHAYSTAEMADSITCWESSFYWAGVMPGDTGFLMVPIGVTSGPQSLLAAFHHYPLQTFAVGALEGDSRLEMMRRFSPHFISTGPVYLRRLSIICQEKGIDPRRDFPDIKAIKLGSFGFEVSWAKEMEEFWGAKIIDTYASTQGIIASTCEHGAYWPDGRRGIMHLPDDRVITEVINPATGEPASDGEEGEVILTPLTRYAMPIMRFRTGDKVVYRDHHACPCGRPFAGIEAGTVSRYDTMFKIRGMNLWPEAVDAVVLAYPDIDEYNGRVLVNDIGREVAKVIIEFKAASDLDASARKALIVRMKADLKEKTNVAFDVIEGVVEKFTYKEKRWKDLRKQNM